MNRAETLQFMQNQFICTQMWVMYWNAMIVSGGYKLTTRARGRKNTPEEIANGDTGLKFRPLTDEEKLEEALGTLQRQINHMHELNEAIANFCNERNG